MKPFFTLFGFFFSCTLTIHSQETCFQNNIINTGNVIDSYWPMNGDGNDVLSPLNNPQGALGAGVTFTGTPFAGTAAASFAGTGGIQYSDGTFMNSLITNVSFGAWIKPAAVPPGGNQIIFDEGGTSGISIHLNTAGELVFVVSDGSQANSTSLRYAFPTDGQYHHIAFNYNGRLEIFLDGKFMQYSNTGFGTIAAHSDAGGLGATFGTTSAAKTLFSSSTFTSYVGLIDEAYYTRNLVSDGNLLQYGRCYGKNNYNNIGCQADAFFIQGDNGSYGSMNLVTGDMSSFLADGMTADQNAIGFNTLDGLIYGIEAATGNIFVTELTATSSGYSYVSTRVGQISTFQGLNLNVGDVYEGKYYVRSGSAGTTFYVVDVNPASPTYLKLLQTITANSSTEMYDWAYNPVDDMLYGIGSATGDLLKIDPATGAVTNLNPTSSSAVPASDYGAVFFDNQGFFYVYNNSTGVVYRIDVQAGLYTGVPFSTGPSGLNKNDGARCADAPLPIDFGDAPDASTVVTGSGTGTGQYQTMLSNDGPRHQVNAFIALRMGATVTLENDGKPAAGATGDTDDGVSSFPSLAGGWLQTAIPSYTVSATVTNQNSSTTATLYAWIDWNCDGVFVTTERVTVAVPAQFTGNVSVTWTNMTLTGPPGTAGTYARFRLSTDVSAENPTGPALDGEVEDYYIPFDFVLPVKLVSFTATVAGQTVIAQWSTATEDNFSHFELERSSNSREYIKIATLAAKGDNSIYSFTDLSPLPGINYYRLKIIDKDGQYTYSPVRLANMSDHADIILYPNPARDHINILTDRSWPGAGTRISLLATDGRILVQKTTSLPGGSSIMLELSQIPPGAYFLHIQTNEKRIIKKIEILR